MSGAKQSYQHTALSYYIVHDTAVRTTPRVDALATATLALTHSVCACAHTACLANLHYFHWGIFQLGHMTFVEPVA